jgi:hypothetical protein
MTRTSPNIYREGRLWQGFDYKLQEWVIDGVYVDCGHPQPGDVLASFPGLRGPSHVFPGCDCYGRLHPGTPTVVGQDHMDGRLAVVA